MRRTILLALTVMAVLAFTTFASASTRNYTDIPNATITSTQSGTLGTMTLKHKYTGATFFTLNTNGDMLFAGGNTFLLGAAEKVWIDAATTAHTNTDGALDIDFASITNDAIGQTITATMNNGTAAGENIYGLGIEMIANDADGDLFGQYIQCNATATAGAGSCEVLLSLHNAENTAGVVPDGILITDDQAGGIIDAVDASDADIVNALNAGPNNVILTTGAITASGNSTWSLTGTDAGNLLLTIDSINAGAGEGRLALNADEQVDIGDGTAIVTLDGGVLSTAGLVSGSITPSAALTLTPAASSTWSVSGNDAGDLTLLVDSVNAGAGNGILSLTADNTVNVGDAAGNPAVNVLGAGLVTVTGNINANGGVDVVGALTADSDSDWTLTGTENVGITSDPGADTAATSMFISIDGEDTIGADEAQYGLLISQPVNASDVDEAADALLVLDNNDVNDPVGAAILILATGAGGYTNYIDSPNFDVTNAGLVRVAAAQGIDTLAAGALSFGNTTATSASICNSAACDTIGIGDNADADAITIGDASDALILNDVHWSISDAGLFLVAAGQGLTTTGAGALNLGTATATSVAIGSGAVTAVTISTDGTGDAEVVLPNDSIGAAEIATGAVVADGIADTTCLQIISVAFDPSEPQATVDYVSIGAIDVATGNASFSVTEANEDQFRVPVAALAHNLSVVVDVDPGNGGADNWAITLRDDAGGTALTCTIAGGTTCTDVANNPAILAGSKLDVLVTSAGGASDPELAAEMIISFCLGQ